MLFDLHNDFLTACPVRERASVLSGYEADGLTGGVFAIWTTRLPGGVRLTEDFALPPSGIRLVTGIEDLGSVREDFRDVFERLRPAYASLTWNGMNALAGGCGAESGLTDEGRRAIDIMAECGVALDLAHLSDAAFYEALRYGAERGCKVLCSHTASRALRGHPRCVTDDMAREIAEAGGLIGAAAVADFLTESCACCDIYDYARHILHLCEVAGAEHVAIGTDYYGTDDVPHGMENYGGFTALADILAREGLTAAEIDGIFYDNAERFFADRSKT